MDLGKVIYGVPLGVLERDTLRGLDKALWDKTGSKLKLACEAYGKLNQPIHALYIKESIQTLNGTDGLLRLFLSIGPDWDTRLKAGCEKGSVPFASPGWFLAFYEDG